VVYGTRIEALLNNIAAWIPSDPAIPPVSIKISSGFESVLEQDLRPYIAVNEDMLTHVVFRGLEAGTIPPRAMSTAFALEDGTLTSEKIDRYCDELVSDLAVKEGRQEIC
jgi:hypothetical protein